jgi:hypothetical protein
MEIRLLRFASAGVFKWRWPSGNVEHFDRSWCGRIAIDGRDFEFRHGLGHRHVYGRTRVHSVTWLTGAPTVEGVEADDYRSSRALLSRLLRDDKKHARTNADIPTYYAGLDTRGLIATGAWMDSKSAERYAHTVVTEEARRAEMLPTPGRKIG